LFLPLIAVLASIVSLCIGSSYAKQLFTDIGPEGATVFRLAFAAVLLVAIWRPWRLPLTLADFKRIALYGVTLGSMNLLFYKGIATIPMGVAIAIEFIGPLSLALLSSRRAIDFVWIALSLIGLLLLSPLTSGTSGVSGKLDPTGVGYILCAAVLWALYIVLGKKAGRSHAGQVTSLGLCIASLVVLPFGAARASTVIFQPHYVLVGLMVAVLSSAIPYSLEFYALKKLPQQTFGILLSMEPAVGAITGWIILGEMLTPIQCLAIACIIVASIGSTATIKKSDDIPLVDAEGIAPEHE
jgi:inner membrane transporter RhtA